VIFRGRSHPDNAIGSSLRAVRPPPPKLVSIASHPRPCTSAIHSVTFSRPAIVFPSSLRLSPPSSFVRRRIMARRSIGLRRPFAGEGRLNWKYVIRQCVKSSDSSAARLSPGKSIAPYTPRNRCRQVGTVSSHGCSCDLPLGSEFKQRELRTAARNARDPNRECFLRDLTTSRWHSVTWTHYIRQGMDNRNNLNRNNLNEAHSSRLFIFFYLHAESFDYPIRISESFAHVATLALYERKARK